MIKILITMNDAPDYQGLQLRSDYARRLVQAGALPLALPHGDWPLAAWDYLADAQGLLLSGGDDLEPWRFGQEARLPLTCFAQRDQAELDLFAAAWQRGLPIFAICRGMQLVNVALGGDLYQDLDMDMEPDDKQGNAGTLRGNALHRHPVEKRYQTQHGVDVVNPGLRRLLGQRAEVNSHHHQAVNRLAPGLLPAAYADDGICEACVAADDHPLLAVQWHPECLDSMQLLFSEFVRLCSER